MSAPRECCTASCVALRTAAFSRQVALSPRTAQRSLRPRESRPFPAWHPPIRIQPPRRRTHAHAAPASVMRGGANNSGPRLAVGVDSAPGRWAELLADEGQWREAQAARGMAPEGRSADWAESPHAPRGGSADDFAWLDVEGAVAAFLPDALHSDAGWQVPLGSYPAPAGGGGWNLSPTRQPLSAEQTVQRSQAASASTLDSVIHKLMLAEQNGEVSAEVAASVRASLQHLQEVSPTRDPKRSQLRQLIHEARPQLPPPPRQPTPPPLMWDASGLGTVNAAAAAAGAAPPLKRTAANMQQQQGRLPLPSFHDTFFVDNGLGSAAPLLPPPESVEAARRAREARQAKRREKTAAAAPAPVAPAAMVADGLSPRAADAAAASTTLGAVATAALNARLDALEKEQRSAAMRLQFMNRQHSEMTLKIESLEARNAALVKENERLTGLWQSAQVFLDQGLGI